MRVLALAVFLAAPASAADGPADEQEWARQIRAAVPASELRSAAAASELSDSEDPLLDLASRYGIQAPEWLQRRVESQGSAITLAALGDSVTAGTASCSFPYIYCPGNSWAAGTLPGSVRSRLQDSSGRPVQGLLVAVPGTGSSAVPIQAFVVYLASAFGLDVRRMTLLVGHNEPGVCGDFGEGGEVQEFEEDLRAALRILGRVARRRQAKLFISSLVEVTSVTRYAEVVPAGAEKSCRELWAENGRCANVLERRGDPAHLARVSERIAAYDGALRRLGERRSRWALYTPTLNASTRAGFPDPAASFSRHDCFHPSASGQDRLGRLAWDGDGEGELPGVSEFFKLEPAPLPPAALALP